MSRGFSFAIVLFDECERWVLLGVAGSQGYSKLFGIKTPEEVEDRKAFIWLSNGLEEAMLGFVAQAKDNTYQLRVAAYEFNYEPFLVCCVLD